MTEQSKGTMTFTPGPWQVLELNWGIQILPNESAVARKRPVIGTVSAWTDDPREDKEARANAHLIAAAPRMADYIRLHAERDPEARAILEEAGVL